MVRYYDIMTGQTVELIMTPRQERKQVQDAHQEIRLWYGEEQLDESVEGRVQCIISI